MSFVLFQYKRKRILTHIINVYTIRSYHKNLNLTKHHFKATYWVDVKTSNKCFTNWWNKLPCYEKHIWDWESVFHLKY